MLPMARRVWRRSPSRSFLQPALLGQLAASTPGSLALKELWQKWTDQAHCFREVLEGRFGSTILDGLRPPQKSSSNVLRHSR